MSAPDTSAPPAAPIRLAVVVLNYQTPDLTLDCLASLVPELGPRDQCVVVDNASPDGSGAAIAAAVEEREWKSVDVVLHEHNGGFAAGNNVGIERVDADYYLLLNSDTIVRPGALATLLAAADAHPRDGLFSPRLEWPDGTGQISCFRFHTPVSELIAGSQTGPIRALLERGRALDSDQTCPHARPTKVRFTLADLEKAFHRR